MFITTFGASTGSGATVWRTSRGTINLGFSNKLAGVEVADLWMAEMCASRVYHGTVSEVWQERTFHEAAEASRRFRPKRRNCGASSCR